MAQASSNNSTRAPIDYASRVPFPGSEGRRAKVSVLLRVMGDEWCHVDEKTEYQELMARSLLIEFIGGEPGEAMRDQFA